MVKLRVCIAAYVCFMAVTTAQAQNNPDMPDSVAQFWKRLARAKTITYTMKRWGWELASDAVPGREIFYVMNTYEVKAQRPNRISIVTSPGLEREVTEEGQAHREFLNDPGETYINNGKQSIQYISRLRIYGLGKGLDVLENDKNNTALIVGVYWIFYSMPLSGCRLIPESLAESSKTVVYALSDPKYPKHEQRIYFDRKTGNLLQTSDYDQDEKGKWIEERREEFQFWDFDVRLPADTFSVRPPHGYITGAEFDKIHNIHPTETTPK